MADIDTNERLRGFMETMQHIVPPFGDLMQNGIPGQGQSNVAAERTQEMQRLAVYFARSYQSRRAGAEEVAARAEELAGAINTVVTLGVIRLETADGLLDGMQELLDNREV